MHLDLVLPGGERVPLDRQLAIGRAPSSDLLLDDPSVSRAHAEIVVDADGAMLQDAGSSYGTFVDGRRLSGPVALAHGMHLELGDCRLEVAERVDRAAAGRTMSVPAGISLIVEQPSVRRTRLRGQQNRKPKLRSGWSLKRMEESEAVGGARFVLKDHRSSVMVRLATEEAELAQLLDGDHDLVSLLGEAGGRWGADGPARLARLLAELADKGMLSGVESEEPSGSLPWLARLIRPRERELPGVPQAMAAVYRRGGWLLFSPAALAVLAVIAVGGLVAFGALIIGRYGTPFVVAQRVGLGALVFVVGRFALVVCHELAHGLVAESFGRPISRAGIKVALVFPYVFVDTTDAWFESRHRRMMISLAGPASDVVLGGAFALACLVAAPGSVRDILFQVAFGGYVGALFNLNPLMERDGYHVLVDLLREPGLRRRATRHLHEILSGRGPADSWRLLVYAVASLVWSVLTVVFAVVLSLRYYPILVKLAPPALVWTVLSAFYLVLALPLAVQLLRPLWTRVYQPRPEVAAR
ncbi:MAG TPA: FHA domain-containing protein [Solirubrobacteraceae bacterium]|nr:FHA domain-containing protein [Solirubrobacteraceae bacterium]